MQHSTGQRRCDANIERQSIVLCGTVVMAVTKHYLCDISSDSDSDSVFEEVVLVYDISKQKRSVWRSQ